MTEGIEPFEIRVDDSLLDDLADRLARTRFPDQIEGTGWEYGIPIYYLRELVEFLHKRLVNDEPSDSHAALPPPQPRSPSPAPTKRTSIESPWESWRLWGAMASARRT